jgi:serine phosphatase RsbU (regulator of sigma subunit)
MSLAQELQSDTFKKAELHTEHLRLLGVLGFVAIFVLVTIVRVFVLRTTSSTAPWERSLLLASIIAAYEGWMLRRVDLALKADRSLPAQFWILSTIVETSIPAFALPFLTGHQIEIAYRPLASPPVLVFFIFIILSTLRLSSWTSVLSGAVASVTYLCAALYLGWRPPVPGVPAPVTQSGVSLNAITLLLGGIVAGAVAGEIRKHVLAALREAEAQSKLKVIQHDLQIAQSIQQSLLPREVPHIPGFDVAGWNRPADDTGGDYFDWKTLPDGKVIVSLADVTGHGIGPALLASVCHAYARSSFSGAQGLATALERINQDLGADLITGRFVTFVAAVCCPTCPDVEMLSAGHDPVLVYSRPEDRFAEMNAQALPFGILPTFCPDPPAHLQLLSGDLILLATDGFFEWESDRGEQFGVPRMEGVIRAARDSSLVQIIARLYEAGIACSNGTRQRDDLAAVLIKRL